MQCFRERVVAWHTVQGAARSIDRRMRISPLTTMNNSGNGVTAQRIRAMLEAGVRTIAQGAGVVPPGIVHRLDKADTAKGLESLQSISDLGAPYPVLLYERFLGRPYATHRDSVSELVGEAVEVAVKNVLTEAKVSFRETKRAERIPGFDQAPDFIIPDEFAPIALIEANLTEDDDTARDKVARVQRLKTLRNEQGKDYDVIACIAGRGFKVRREDMRRLLQATDGKVFTLTTMHLLIEHTHSGVPGEISDTKGYANQATGAEDLRSTQSGRQQSWPSLISRPLKITLSDDWTGPEQARPRSVFCSRNPIAALFEFLVITCAMIYLNNFSFIFCVITYLS
jgi:hypothetical protein